MEAKNIVLVHGAFADETSWDKVAKILAAKGYNVTHGRQPADLAGRRCRRHQGRARRPGRPDRAASAIAGAAW